MRFQKGNKSRVAHRGKEQYSRTCIPLLRTIAKLAENADNTSPRDLSRQSRHHLELEHTLPSEQKRLELNGQPNAVDIVGHATDGRVPMAYYKIRIEVWCDWDPMASELEEIVENI